MRVLSLLLVVCCLVVLCNSTIVAVGPWKWDASGPPNAILSEIYSNSYSTYDAIDGWFWMYAGGSVVTSLTANDLVFIKPGGSYQVFQLANQGPVSGAITSTTLRIDDSGTSTCLWEFTNPGATPLTLQLSNNGFDNKGSDSSSRIFATSSGDLAVNTADTWAVSYEYNGPGVATDPILVFSFGEANLLDSLIDYGGTVRFDNSITIPPGSTVGFLEILSVVNNYMPNALQVSQTRATNSINSAAVLYNYQTLSGNRLLGHLTANQLLAVANWDFASGGVGGDPHGVNFDGSLFELPNFPQIYCLYSDGAFQVNIRVESAYVKEIVVFVRSHGIVVHADVTSGEPKYFVGERQLSVPSESEHGLISTRTAPFYFKSTPLNQLERYQTSGVFVRNMVTIVGGDHPQNGGFFNIAVFQRPDTFEFPSILQLPMHPLRELGFTASVISDVWFDSLE